MTTTVASLRRDFAQVRNYEMVVGYGHSAAVDGTVADTLRRVGTLYLTLTPDPPSREGEGDRVQSAVVKFLDQGAGPVTSLGRVIQETGALRLEVSLPEDQFVAFWHAIQHPEHVVAMAWKEGDEVVDFWVVGFRAPEGEDRRERLESLQRELSGEPGTK